MLEIVNANRFDRKMQNGRTGPCLMSCETEAGDDVEVVVKLRGSPHIAPGGLLAEAIVALLALELDLPIQTPYVVNISTEFANSVVNDDVRSVLFNSIGTNFGSSKWSTGRTIWLPGMPMSHELSRRATEVYAFDALIQNPDRTTENPNLAFIGSKPVMYDHELAFSSLRDVLQPHPWMPEFVQFMKNHVLFKVFKGTNLELTRYKLAFKSLSVEKLQHLLDSVPDDWQGSMISKDSVRRYLMQCQMHFDVFCQNLEALR